MIVSDLFWDILMAGSKPCAAHGNDNLTHLTLASMSIFENSNGYLGSGVPPGNTYSPILRF